MIAAYGPYAASATGGNDLARDFLAGVAALYSTPCKFIAFSALLETDLHPVYENVGNKKWHLIYPSVILACLAIPIIIPIYVFYWKGKDLRLKSPFAQELEQKRQARIQRRKRGSMGDAKDSEKQVEKV